MDFLPAGTSRVCIAWVVDSIDYDIASFRYRSLIPSYALAAAGIESIFVTADHVSISDADIFVFIKAFGQEHLELANALHHAGRPYILDLCDNIFGSKYASKRHAGDPRNFMQMARFASAIVVTCDALADIVGQHLAQDRRAFVIPDAAFSLKDHSQLFDWYAAMQLACKQNRQAFLSTSDLADAPKRPVWDWAGRNLLHLISAEKSKQRQLKRILAKSSSEAKTDRRRKLVWFGKHGTTYGKAGMQSLVSVFPNLIKINAEAPIELVVISNSRKKFKQLFSGLPFPVRYRAWSNESVFDELGTAEIFLMPNETDEFSACKSANRAVLSLAMGVPVIATWLDSLKPLSRAIVIDDWDKGLRRYLFDKQQRDRDLKNAVHVIADLYAPQAIRKRWKIVISAAQRRLQDQLVSNDAQLAMSLPDR